jgi:undecaprenyl-diphosphatase
MEIITSIVLGLVQGLTEFLPISSTAHLRVIPALLGWPDPGAAFSAVVQLGTLAAVFVYFFKDLWEMAKAWMNGLVSGKPFQDQKSKMAWIIILGTLPVGVIGLLFQESIKTTLRSLWVVSLALIGLALILALAEKMGRRNRQLEQVGWLDGLIIGCAQALALIPGASRSGVTITAGLFTGLNRADAARFSFLLSVPAIAASGLYELWELIQGVFGPVESWGSIIIATTVAGISGYLAIAGLIGFLKKRSTFVFIVYRIILGSLVIILISLNLLTA